MFHKCLNSSKWSGKTEGQVYALTLADMDFPLYQPFKKRLVQDIKNLNNLTYKNRSNQYFQALIKWYRIHHSAQLKSSDFVECPSICNLIGCCIMAFTKEEQNVLIFTPVYSFYINAIKQLNRSVVACGLKEVALDKKENIEQSLMRYEFDMQEFKEKMDKFRPGLIILCNPHNPSGKIFTKLQINLIVKKAQEYNTFILSDQIMGDFTLSQSKYNQNNFISLATYPYDKIIVGNSISKVFNCESVQGGYGIIKSQQVRSRYKQISHKAFKLLTNQMSLILTPIVYNNDGIKWITKINSIIQANFSLLKKTFKNQRCLKIFQLQASYLTAIQFNFPQSNTSYGTNKHLSSLLALLNIYFIDMQDYFEPPSQRNIFRISIAIHPEEFKKFIIKFKHSINCLKENLIKSQTKDDLMGIRKSKL